MDNGSNKDAGWLVFTGFLRLMSCVSSLNLHCFPFLTVGSKLSLFHSSVKVFQKGYSLQIKAIYGLKSEV